MEENFICDVCDIRCTGIEPYMQHMGSNKHKKKEEQRKLQVTTDSLERSFFCSTCGIPCSGIIPYQQHITSEKHLKKQQAKEFNEKNPFLTPSNVSCSADYEMNYDCSSALNSALSKKDECDVSSSEVVDQRSYTALHTQTNFKCLVCDKHFTGFVPYEQHVNGSAHKKKMKQRELQSALESGKIDIPKNGILVAKETCSTSVSDTDNLMENSACEEKLFKCNLCGEDFPSQEICNFHMLSSVHNTERRAFPFENGYFCSVCNKKFTGSIPFEQHMSSAVHQKNVKRAELFANLSGEKNSEANTNPSDVENVNQNTMEKTVENTSFSVSALCKMHNIGITDSNSVLAECYVCNVKIYSSEEIKKHYESESHYDNQNIYEYKKKVGVFAPEDPFSLSP